MITNYNSKPFVSIITGISERDQIHVIGTVVAIFLIVISIVRFKSGAKGPTKSTIYAPLGLFRNTSRCHIPWRKQKEDPTQWCQSFSSSDSESADLEEDILLAVSTLFQECEENDDQDDNNLQTNTIVARIVPRNCLEFQNHKITARQVDATKLRETIEEKFPFVNTDECENENLGTLPDNCDLVVCLEVDATVPSTCDPRRRYHFRMNMK
jgi:hypothetical protein